MPYTLRRQAPLLLILALSLASTVGMYFALSQAERHNAAMHRASLIDRARLAEQLGRIERAIRREDRP